MREKGLMYKHDLGAKMLARIKGKSKYVNLKRGTSKVEMH